MRPWLKAGLIGGGVLVLLTIIANLGMLFPKASTIISCCLCIPILLAYPGTGALAAYWLTPPRTAGEGAKEGALAGVIAGAIDGVVSVILSLVLGTAGVYQQALSQLPPETMEALEEMGLSGMYTAGGMATLSCVGGICGILWAAAMGAAGGAILAAAKRD
jgi:hypothetical protein